MELAGCDTFEWIRLVRRIRDLDGMTKCVGLMLASYADKDGTRIFPGTERTIHVCQISRAKVLSAMATLREQGLIERVTERRGNGRKGGLDIYRLTVPADILVRFRMLTPDDCDPDKPARNGSVT